MFLRKHVHVVRVTIPNEWKLLQYLDLFTAINSRQTYLQLCNWLQNNPLDRPVQYINICMESEVKFYEKREMARSRLACT